VKIGDTDGKREGDTRGNQQKFITDSGRDSGTNSSTVVRTAEEEQAGVGSVTNRNKGGKEGPPLNYRVSLVEHGDNT